MNNLFNQLNPLSKQLPTNVKQMISMYKGISNPQAMAQKMMNENPQLASLIQAANGNPEQAFRNLASKMGVDPEQIISLLK